MSQFTPFSQLDFEVAAGQASQRTAERWWPERREETLGQGVARSAKRAHAGGRARPVGTKEKDGPQECIRIRTGQNAVGQAHAPAAQKRTGPRPQTTREIETGAMIDRYRSAAGGRNGFHFCPHIYNHAFLGENLTDFENLFLLNRMCIILKTCCGSISIQC
jgi:hypothetical protein